MDEKLRAEEAARILATDTFLQAMKDLREQTVTQWAACPARDTEAREWLWMFYQNTMRFEDVLKGFLATGKIQDFNRKQPGIINRVTSILKR